MAQRRRGRCRLRHGGAVSAPQPRAQGAARTRARSGAAAVRRGHEPVRNRSPARHLADARLTAPAAGARSHGSHRGRLTDTFARAMAQIAIDPERELAELKEYLGDDYDHARLQRYEEAVDEELAQVG